MSEKVLVLIDDDEDLRGFLALALRQAGYIVHSYGDPLIALMNLRMGNHDPHLIVLDYQMDSMTGLEFLNHKTNNCPVIMISASPEEIAREPHRPYQELHLKPLNLPKLMLSIKSYFE